MSHKVHKYERLKLKRSNRFIYKCLLPNCNHFLPEIELAIGRLSLCWGGCGKAVMITKHDIGRGTKRPMCEDCKQIRQETIKKQREMEIMT